MGKKSKKRSSVEVTEADLESLTDEVEQAAEPVVEPEATRRTRRKPGVTYVPVESLLVVVEEVGLRIEEKKAWLRIDGPSGARVYLPRRKEIGRVDIAGMEAPGGTSVKLGERSFGSVREQLDMRLSEDDVLQNFRSVLIHMASLPASKATGGKDQDASEATGQDGA